MFQNPVFVLAGSTIAGTMLLQAHERQSYHIHMTLNEPIAMQNTMDLKEPIQRTSNFFCPAQTPHQSAAAGGPASGGGMDAAAPDLHRTKIQVRA